MIFEWLGYASGFLGAGLLCVAAMFSPPAPTTARKARR